MNAKGNLNTWMSSAFIRVQRRLNSYRQRAQSTHRIRHTPLDPGIRSGTIHPNHRAYSTVRISRRTVMRISPGKVISSLTRLAMLRAMTRQF